MKHIYLKFNLFEYFENKFKYSFHQISQKKNIIKEYLHIFIEK